MFGQRTMTWVDKRLLQATGKLNSPLGGISVIIIGDFRQLSPVGDRPIYAEMLGSVLGDHGHSIYTLFTAVVQLTDIVHQSGANPEASSFRQLLLNLPLRLRYSITIHKSQRQTLTVKPSLALEKPKEQPDVPLLLPPESAPYKILSFSP